MERKVLIIIAIVALGMFAAPDVLSLFVGQHYFHDDVECIRCHVAEYDDISLSHALTAHKRAANNTNYTTYMSVGGIFYNNSSQESKNGTDGTYAVIYSMDLLNATIGDNSTYGVGNVSYFWNNSSGRWDKASWNGSTWQLTSISCLIDLDHDNNSQINGYEICFLCHKTELIGSVNTVHSATVILCDDDRCHGNKNNAYNDYKLFSNVSVGVVEAGKTISMNNVHSYYYLYASNQSSSYRAGSRFNHSIGNAIPAGDYISKGHWTCESCHSSTEKSVVLIPRTKYNHSDFDAPRSRY